MKSKLVPLAAKLRSTQKLSYGENKTLLNNNIFLIGLLINPFQINSTENLDIFQNYDNGTKSNF